MQVAVTNILDMVESIGEETTLALLQSFSCVHTSSTKTVDLNPDIESFIQSKSLHFARQKVSVTYIVQDNTDGTFLGFFTLAHKPVIFPADGMSKTARRTMERYSMLDAKSNSYEVSGFLIAQFGKNYGIDNGQRITGAELLSLAERELRDIQRRVGGGIEYQDCEACSALIRFYESQGFRLFGERVSETDGRHYLQYMKFF